MKQKFYTIATIVAILSIAVLSLSACGRNRNENGRRQNNALRIYDEATGLPIRTLTVRTSNLHTATIQQAAAAMNATWQERGEPYIFQVEIQDHPWHDWDGTEARQTRIKTELMAGQGPDIIVHENMHQVHALATSGFLQNIYTLIDEDPNSSIDEFFTQALQAFEINNGLYVFPLSFGFDYVAVNANLPQTFIDRFTQKSSISFTEMMAFYLDLMDAYGEEFGHLEPDGFAQLSSLFTMRSTINEFIDFNTRTANLTDPSFIETLELFPRIYDDRVVLRVGQGGTPNMLGFMQDQTEEAVFFWFNIGLAHFDTFFAAEPPTFIHYIPLTDNHGRLMISNSLGGGGKVWACISIVTTGNQTLAWELARHMVYAYTNPVGLSALNIVRGAPNLWGNRSFATPIMRSFFPEQPLRIFEHMYNEYYHPAFGPNTPRSRRMQGFTGFDDPANRTRQFTDAVNRIGVYNEQSMGLLFPLVPDYLFEDHLDQLLYGLITAETAAQRMQNAVSLWLIE